MRVIVFDRELHEPLTVVEVPEWLAARAKTGEKVKLPYMERLPVGPISAPAPESGKVRSVSLTFEPVHREREILFWYAYADDPETALLLRAAFLPGQVNEVRHLEALAEIKGAMRVAGL